MTVGGWFDAEDLFGPLNIYRSIETKNPDTFNILVMGPWDHGGWARQFQKITTVGNLAFGENISDFYQREIEAPFFRHFLKGTGEAPKYEAMMFDTGTKTWHTFQKWPPSESKPGRLYFRSGGRLTNESPTEPQAFSEFVSDPANPVPYRKQEDIRIQFTPRYYMTDDQRFATSRAQNQKDLLVFQTGKLQADFTLAGNLMAHLNVATTGTDADWVVKLIDVYPDDTPQVPGTARGVQLAGYQQMVRSEVIRGRFRDSFEHPEPFVSGEVTTVNLPLQDVFHTFKKGHRVMVHVQSTWFPLIDRNPQKFVDNIFEAKAEDFIRATHRVYHSPEHESWIEFCNLNE